MLRIYTRSIKGLYSNGVDTSKEAASTEQEQQNLYLELDESNGLRILLNKYNRNSNEDSKQQPTKPFDESSSNNTADYFTVSTNAKDLHFRLISESNKQLNINDNDNNGSGNAADISKGKQLTVIGTLTLPVSHIMQLKTNEEWFDVNSENKTKYNDAISIQLQWDHINSSDIRAPSVSNGNNTNEVNNGRQTPPSPQKTPAVNHFIEDEWDLPRYLPCNLVDYFVVAGLAPPSADAGYGDAKDTTKNKPAILRRSSSSHQGEGGSGHIEYNVASTNSVASQTKSAAKVRDYNPVILDRFPREDHPNLPFPMKVEWFMHPNGISPSRQLINEDTADATFFTFVQQSNLSVKLYGYCMRVMEPVPPGYGRYSNGEYYAPICLCILSRIPCESCFREVLWQLLRAGKSSYGEDWLKPITPTENEGKSEKSTPKLRGLFKPRIEEAVLMLVREIPMPIPGSLAVEFSLPLLAKQSPIRCKLPRLGDFPALLYPLGLLFSRFGMNDVIDLWSAILLEYRIIIHSKDYALPTAIAESLLNLIYPFQWPHPCIPVLPIQLIELTQAPTLFIFGMHSDMIKHVNKAEMHDLVIVDIDKGSIYYIPPKIVDVDEDEKGINHSFGKVNSIKLKDKLPELPTSVRRRLVKMLRGVLLRNRNVAFCDDVNPPKNDTSSCIIHIPTDMDPARYESPDPQLDRNIQFCFLEAIATMLQGYQDCLFFLDESSPVFNEAQFLEEKEKINRNIVTNGEAEHSAGLDFLTILCKTQLFDRFKVDQSSQELALFHVYYKYLRPRERDQRVSINPAIRSSVKNDEDKIKPSPDAHHIQMWNDPFDGPWKHRDVRVGLTGIEPIPVLERDYLYTLEIDDGNEEQHNSFVEPGLDGKKTLQAQQPRFRISGLIQIGPSVQIQLPKGGVMTSTKTLLAAIPAADPTSNIISPNSVVTNEIQMSELLRDRAITVPVGFNENYGDPLKIESLIHKQEQNASRSRAEATTIEELIDDDASMIIDPRSRGSTDGSKNDLYNQEIWPNGSYIHTTYGRGRVIKKRNNGSGIVKIKLDWGGKLYGIEHNLVEQVKGDISTTLLAGRVVQTPYGMGFVVARTTYADASIGQVDIYHVKLDFGADAYLPRSSFTVKVTSANENKTGIMIDNDDDSSDSSNDDDDVTEDDKNDGNETDEQDEYGMRGSDSEEEMEVDKSISKIGFEHGNAARENPNGSAFPRMRNEYFRSKIRNWPYLRTMEKLGLSDIEWIERTYRELERLAFPPLSTVIKYKPKTELERIVERTLQSGVTEIFFNRSIPSKLLGECIRYMETQTGRNLFVFILKQPSKTALTSGPTSGQQPISSARQRFFQSRGITFNNNGSSSSDTSTLANRQAHLQPKSLIRNFKSNAMTTSSSFGGWGGTGQGRCLGNDAFNSLLLLSNALLTICAKREDYTNGRLMLQLSSCYYRDGLASKDIEDNNSLSPGGNNGVNSPGITRRTTNYRGSNEYLQKGLRNHPLFHSLNFWEHAFAESLASEFDISTPPSSMQNKSDKTNIERMKFYAELIDMWKHERLNGDQKHKMDSDTKLFELVTTLVNTMLDVGVPESMAQALVARIVITFQLDSEQEETLNILVANVARAYLMQHQDELRIKEEAEKAESYALMAKTAASKKNESSMVKDGTSNSGVYSLGSEDKKPSSASFLSKITNFGSKSAKQVDGRSPSIAKSTLPPTSRQTVTSSLGKIATSYLNPAQSNTSSSSNNEEHILPPQHALMTAISDGNETIDDENETNIDTEMRKLAGKYQPSRSASGSMRRKKRIGSQTSRQTDPDDDLHFLSEDDTHSFKISSNGKFELERERSSSSITTNPSGNKLSLLSLPMHGPRDIFHTKAITCLKVNSSSKFLVTGSLDSTIQVWDLNPSTSKLNQPKNSSNMPKQLAVLQGHTEGVTCLAMSKIGHISNTYLLSGSNDSTVRFWWINPLIQGPQRYNPSSAWENEMLKLYNYQQPQNRISPGLVSDKGRSTPSNNSNQQTTGKKSSSANESPVNISALFAQRQGHVLRGHTGTVTGLSFFIGDPMPDPKQNLRVNSSATISEDEQDGIADAIESDQPRRAVSAGMDSRLIIWNLQTLNAHHVYNGAHTNGITCMDVASDDDILTGGQDGLVHLWDVESNQKSPLVTFRGHQGPITTLHFDLFHIATAGMDGKCLLWDRRQPEPICKFSGHKGAVRCIQPFGIVDQTIITGCDDSIIRIWDVRKPSEMEPMKSLVGHSGAITCLKRDWTKIVSGSADSTVKIWEPSTGECVFTSPPNVHRSVISAMWFDSDRIITGSYDATAKIFCAQ